MRDTISLTTYGADEQLSELKDSVSTAITESQEIEVVISDMDVESASHYVKNFNTIRKRAEELRKTEVAPLNEEVKHINNIFKDLISPVEAEESRLKTLLLAYSKRKAEIERQKVQEERKRREEEALNQAIAEGRNEVPVIPEVITAKLTLSGRNSSGVGTMRVPKWEVVDFSRVPDEYKIINEKLLNSIRKVAGTEAVSNIPGIRFYFEETIVSR